MMNSEIKWVRRFVVEEVPESVGLKYAPTKIRKYFDIKTKNGLWGSRKKKQEKRQTKRK